MSNEFITTDSEIIFDEIIDVDGILDNNGRQLNEIFLTTFKIF